jgi:hypothetical protein
MNMNICMLCYDDIEDNFFCCDCLLNIFEYSICNKHLKLMEVIELLYYNKTENKNYII